MRIASIGILSGVLLAAAALAEAPRPMGDEFQVNSYTTSYQQTPAVAVAPSGGGASGHFVVVWASDGSAGSDQSGFSVQGQRFSPDDSGQGQEVQINTYTTAGQDGPAVAMAPSGDFVVVWSSVGSAGSDASGGSVRGQRFGADGSPRGDPFQVNTYTTFNQMRPAAAVAANGDFVVAWTSDGSGGSDNGYSSSIQGQRFAADGSRRGGEFQVNTYTTSYQYQAAVGMAANGDFVVVWTSKAGDGSDTSDASIQGQLFASDGSLVGGQFQVNTYTPDLQYYPAVGMAADGDFVVVWASDSSSSSFFDLRAQRFAADGSPRGGEFQVNTYDPGAQRAPAVAMARSGDFLVVWGSDGSNGSDTSLSSIQGQWFASDGTLLGDPFQINSYTPGNQHDPAVAVTPKGDFLVVWGSDGSNGSDTSMGSVQAQRFAGILFANGFEDGDLSDWSDPIQ